MTLQLGPQVKSGLHARNSPTSRRSDQVGSCCSASRPVLLAARPSHVWSSATRINIIGYNFQPLCCSSSVEKPHGRPQLNAAPRLSLFPVATDDLLLTLRQSEVYFDQVFLGIREEIKLRKPLCVAFRLCVNTSTCQPPLNPVQIFSQVVFVISINTLPCCLSQRLRR